jgi:hypothetical protein
LALKVLDYVREPIAACEIRIELVGVHLVPGDRAGARTLLREIDELLTHRPA